jgi:tetratricopeptide (TPR) repeat protein
LDFLKSANHLLLSVVSILFLGFSGISQKKPDKYTDFDRGYYFFYYKKWDSAFLMFNRYVNDPEDSLKKGKAYGYMGEIFWKIGNIYSAQQSLLDAFKTLDPLNKNHHEEIAIVYNLLGNISQDLKQYDEAITFYNKAMTFSKGTDYLFEVMNGKATAFQKNGNYHDAIAIYDSALSINPANQLLVARVIHNRARTKWLQNPDYSALPEFQAALKIRSDSQYSLGLNASYAHLSDYYAKLNADSALWYAQKMREKAKENQSPDDILEAIDKLIRLTNSPALKEQWYEEYKILNDSLQLSRDTTVNRVALIRYDAQKSKADNLVLQQHITKQRTWIYGVAALAVSIIAALSAWYAKRRRKIKQDADIAIRDSKFKTSQKVHDVVANQLYRIMNELEHSNTIDKETLTNKIEVLYEQSRDISYEDIPVDYNVDYNAQTHDLLKAFDNEHTKVFIVGNGQTFWSKVTEAKKYELLLILKEIMVNMKKHSHAKNVVLVFKWENNKAFIAYNDDGVGFPESIEFGNGLNNTVSRIKSLNGVINFEKSEKGGASILISFPLQSSKI